MATRKYVSLSKLSTFLDNLKNLFASREEFSYFSGNIQNQLNNKVDSDELSNFYTKTDIDDLELITTNDIDDICGTEIQIAREVTF